MAVLSSVLSYLTSLIPGSRLVDGGDVLTGFKYHFQVQTGLIALAGGNAAAGTQLGIGMNKVDTVATAADSVRLPPAIGGSLCEVWNNDANSMQVFGQQANQGGLAAGDQIVPNGSNVAAAVATGVAHASNARWRYRCYVSGVWVQG